MRNFPKLEPRNNEATRLVEKAISRLDGRLKFDEGELKLALSLLLGSRHKAKINLAGFPKIADALVDAGVIKRHSGRRDFTLNPEFQKYEAHFQTIASDAKSKFPIVTKCGTHFRNCEEASSLDWEDVARIGNQQACFLTLNQIGETLAMWADGYKPANRFETVVYQRVDEEAANQFVASLLEAAQRRVFPIAAISTGFVVADLPKALLFLDAQTNRFTNKSDKRFSATTIDKHGRIDARLGKY
jgi:hypothetical protein